MKRHAAWRHAAWRHRFLSALALTLLLTSTATRQAAHAAGGFSYCLNGVKYWYNRWQSRWEARGTCGTTTPAAPATPPPCQGPLQTKTIIGPDGQIYIHFYIDCPNPPQVPSDIPLDDPDLDDPVRFRDRMREEGIPDDQIRELWDLRSRANTARRVIRKAL